MKKLAIALMLFPVLVVSEPKYLGKLSSNEFDPESVSNPFGRYGSEFSQDSIKNKFSRYGSEFSNTSVNNPYATRPPKIIEKDGELLLFSDE